MAQRKNKKPTKNESGLDVVNPQGMTNKELDELDAKANEAKDNLNAQLKRIQNRIRGKLWLWWILPIFGWIVYYMVYTNRLQKEDNQTKLILVKRAIAEKEIQLMLDKKQREENDNKDPKN